MFASWRTPSRRRADWHERRARARTVHVGLTTGRPEDARTVGEIPPREYLGAVEHNMTTAAFRGAAGNQV